MKLQRLASSFVIIAILAALGYTWSLIENYEQGFRDGMEYQAKTMNKLIIHKGCNDGT